MGNLELFERMAKVVKLHSFDSEIVGDGILIYIPCTREANGIRMFGMDIEKATTVSEMYKILGY